MGVNRLGGGRLNCLPSGKFHAASRNGHKAKNRHLLKMMAGGYKRAMLEAWVNYPFNRLS